MNSSTLRVVSVPASRLAWGVWDHEKEREYGEGDIRGAYSADRIVLSQPIAKPFRFEGFLWCTVSSSNAGDEAYRIEPQSLYAEKPLTYAEKVIPDGGDSARSDPRGFYHGMLVRRGKEMLVLVGPPVFFNRAEEKEVADAPVAETTSAEVQLNLF